MATAYHLVHYKKFSASGADKPFESLCRTVLDNTDASGSPLWARVMDRVHRFDPTGSRQMVLNKVADLTTAVFGEICLADTQGLQALLQQERTTVSLSDRTKAEVFNLDERTAPKGTHFLRGLAYWLAIKDHLFFVKTSSMTADLLKSHLEWMLKGHSGGLSGESQVILQTEFDKSQVAGDIGDIRTLRVRGNAVPSYSVNTVDGDETPGRVRETIRTVGDRVVQFKQAVPVVEALFGPSKTQSLLESMGPDEYLSVDATVRVRGRRTQKSKDNLRKLANDLDDITDGNVQIEGKDGKLSDGDAILRTRMPFDLPHEGSNLLDFNNVADQLQEVYARFVRDGKIKA